MAKKPVTSSHCLNVTGFLSRLKLFHFILLDSILSKHFFRGILYFSLLHFTLFSSSIFFISALRMDRVIDEHVLAHCS